MSDDQGYSTREELFESFGQHVNGGKVATFQKYGLDVVMGQREGVYFHDAYSDRRWINCHCNGGLFNWGHRNPVIIEAVVKALEAVDAGNHHLVSAHRARLGERLAATTGGRLSGVVFGVGGGEAIDLAIKVARASTSRSKIVSAQGGYHGHTGLALAAGDAQYRDPFGPSATGFVQVPFNELEPLATEVNDDTAAVILETIPATLGMPIPFDGYLKGVETLCHERGALLILDEVQTGLGRTGKVWGYEHDDVEPDIVVTGKGLGGGIYPISATLMTAEIHSFFDDNPFIHISTYGGAEPGCAAAMAVLDLVLAPGFLERVDEVSGKIVDAFAPCRFELRHRGLMMGLELESELAGMMAMKLMYDAGVFTVYAGNEPKVLQFLPPLTITDDELDDLIGRVTQVFSSSS